MKLEHRRSSRKARIERSPEYFLKDRSSSRDSILVMEAAEYWNRDQLVGLGRLLGYDRRYGSITEETLVRALGVIVAFDELFE